MRFIQSSAIPFLIFLLISFSPKLTAQSVYDFEDGFRRNMKQTYCKIAEVEGNNLARLFQDGSSIEFEFENVSEISFRYSAKKVGDNYSLILETRIDNGKSWERLSSIIAKDEDSRIDVLLLPKTHAVSENLGKRFFRLRLVYPESGGNGEAYIDDIASKEISGARMREMQERMRTENVIDEVQKTLLSEEKNKCEDIAGQYSRIQKSYLSNFEKLVKLNYRSNVVVLVGKLTEYSNSRSQMGNPVVYSEFTETIANIKAEGDALTDTIVGGFVSQLANNIATRTSISSSGKQSGFGKVVNVLKEVGNLISIGRVDNVINSVKSIVGTLFNKQSLEAKYPIKEFIEEKKIGGFCRKMSRMKKKSTCSLSVGWRICTS